MKRHSIIVPCISVTPVATTAEPDPDYMVELIGGSTAREGDVQISYRGTPGIICDDYFDVDDANVICKMAGFP